MYEKVDQVLREVFGMEFLFPFQRLVVANLLGEDERYFHQIVVLPTGAGKSLCFQLPAMVLEGSTLVVYPLLSLMSDQARRMEERKIPVAILKGGQSRSERAAVERRISSGAVRVIITNPETLSQPPVTEFLSTVSLSHAVIDEAHCVSQWGESFRPAYLELGAAFAAIGVNRITAFTATASTEVLAGIRRYLFPEGAHLIQGNTDRSNIYYRVVPATIKVRTLAEQIRAFPRPALVFCSTRVGTENVAVELVERLFPVPVRFYHAGLSRERKVEIEEWFFRTTEGVLVATCAYGMGVDKPDIRHVLHHDIPASAEAYLQESGRGGRDREPARATIVYDHTDEARFLDADSGPVSGIIHSAECRRSYLAKAMGQEQEECTGCDVCDSSVAQSDPMEKTVLSFFSTHPGRFTKREASRILGASLEDQEDIRTAIGILHMKSAIRIRRNGYIRPGRGRVPERRFSGRTGNEATAPSVSR